MSGMRIMTQVCCLETMARIPLSISVNPMTSAAASNPPTTPPSAEVPIFESNVEWVADASCSFMDFLQVHSGARVDRLEDNWMKAERLWLVWVDAAQSGRSAELRR